MQNQWSQDMNLVHAINVESLKFKRWIRKKGFQPDPDFPAMQYQLYERTDGRTDKLPGGLDVQTIYEGSVLQIMQPFARSLPTILIEHGSKGYDMISTYHPVKPCVQLGEQVNKGQKIGSSNHDGVLILHLINGREQMNECYTNVDRIARSIDPATVFFADDNRSKEIGIEYRL